MKVSIAETTPEVLSTTSASIVLKDSESGLPVVEIAIRGAGYVVLTDAERQAITDVIVGSLTETYGNPSSLLLPREGGYHGEPRLWEEVAAASAEKRAASRGGGVVKVAGRSVKVPTSLADINYPEGANFDADGIILVPSRKGEDATMKSFRRACKRAKASQMAFLAAQKDPGSVTEGEADAEGDDE